MLTSNEFDYLRETLLAPVYDVAIETPLSYAKNLSQVINDTISKTKTTATSNNSSNKVTVYLKREDLQPVFSFKIRGAYNKIRALDEDKKKCGIIAVSAGNHAQGVALAAQKLNIPATIVMPLATPSIKYKNVARLGAKVILYGNDFDEAKKEASRLAKEYNLTDIPPYDDPYVISGQGTVGVELLRQLKDIDTIFCACGGGGLVSGIAAYVKRICPNIKVIAVETLDSYAMFHALRNGQPTELPQVGLFADGAAVRLVGKETFKLCYNYLDGIILVSNDDICAAIKDIFEDTRSVVEPAGALGLAGLKKFIKILQTRTILKENGTPQTTVSSNENTPFYYFENQNLLLSNQYFLNDNNNNNNNNNYIAILSGANMNFDRLRFVADRADIGLNKEALISVVVPEKPGSFIKLHNMILPRSVTSFSYRYSNPNYGYIILSFGLNNPSNRSFELNELFEQLISNDFKVEDLSNNDLAKDHARFLVGGRVNVKNERLFRFEFPERPDALAKFLIGLKFDWNVSLFHYRNYGGDTGKVLVGIQIPNEENEAWLKFLNQLNYPWVEETDNLVYENFLKN